MLDKLSRIERPVGTVGHARLTCSLVRPVLQADVGLARVQRGLVELSRVLTRVLHTKTRALPGLILLENPGRAKVVETQRRYECFL